MEQLPVGVLITDKNGSIVQANKRLEEIMGMRFPKGTTAGKDMVVYSEYKGNPAKPSDSATALALSTGKPVLGREYVVTRKDGQKRHVLVNATPIIGKSGRIFAAASIISDITTQKELEQRKDDFLNMASHELKTPITSLKVYLHTLQNSVKKFRDEKTNKMLAGTIYQMDKLQKLVVDLLDVSRLQTGKLSFTMEEFRLDELVGEAIEELQATTTDHTITYIGRKAMFAHGDKFRIYQVLTNLINNAVKYSPDKAKVVVRIRKEGRKNIVSVQDFGIGIDEGEKEKIFERLYQVNDVVGQSFPGFGMGLYIAREIVKRHKGNIWVNSTKGKGSIFYFSLPVPKSKKLKQEK